MSYKIKGFSPHWLNATPLGQRETDHINEWLDAAQVKPIYNILKELFQDTGFHILEDVRSIREFIEGAFLGNFAEL